MFARECARAGATRPQLSRRVAENKQLDGLQSERMAVSLSGGDAAMGQVGERIENPVTGEVVVFRATTAATRGASLEFDYIVPGRYVIAPPHVHRRQQERTEVVSGCLSGRVAGRKRVVGPGEVVAVAPGVVHAWRNASADSLHVVVEFRPALQIEAMFEHLFALARAGKTNARGLPPPLHMALLAHDYCDEAAIPLLPRASQRAILAGPAALARRRGYRSSSTSANGSSQETSP